MEWSQVIELLTSIAASLGIMARARRKIVEEIKGEIIFQLEPVLKKFEASEQRQKDQVEKLNDTFHMIYDVMQMAGQDDAEKYRMMVLTIEKLNQTIEELIIKINQLEKEIHHD